MRTKKAFLNIISSLSLQLVTVICGFILPRLIILQFGSNINGAISSITQFLSYISMIEAGVGGVTRAALYKPLAENDYNKISAIVNATQLFFRNIARVFVIYTIIIGCIYNRISDANFSWLFSFSLVLIISISTFMQYYFGITYSVVLQASQNQYISNIIQIFTIIINTVLSATLIMLGANIHLVKLVASLVYILRPIILNLFVCKKYHINKAIQPDFSSINNRWSGLGQHIAFFVHNQTDIVVITLFLGLKWVSVYAVYLLIVGGVKKIVISIIGGVEAAFGDMIAKDQKDALQKNFSLMETLTSIVVITLFTSTGILLFDFINLYTSGVQDINYIVKPLGICFVVSEALHCIKQPYNSLVLAAGHYKETQTGAFIEAGINVFLSLILVCVLGAPGVLLATAFSTLIRTFEYAYYLKSNILFRNFGFFVKRQLINILIVSCVLLVNYFVPKISITNYLQWCMKGLIIVILSSIIAFVINLVFYANDIKNLSQKIMSIKKND